MHPTVDIRDLLPHSMPSARSSALCTMRHALEHHGYFYAANAPSLPSAYIERTYDLLRRAHDLPLDVKRRYARPEGSYSGADAGVNEMTYQPGTKASVRSWDYGRLQIQSRSHRYPGNAEGLEDFEASLSELYDRQDELAEVLLVAFAEMLALPPEAFLQHFRDPAAAGLESPGGDLGTIRLLHYPGGQEARGGKGAAGDMRSCSDNGDEGSSKGKSGTNGFDFGIAPHTDFELFTLMHQDAPGLQFLAPDAKGIAEGGMGTLNWTDAPLRDDHVVIIGDILERFTNGVLKATPHRVLLTQWQRRSIIRFNAVAPNTLVQPLPQFVSPERPTAYSPVTMRTHMETTLSNLEKGIGAWDPVRNVSLTATYQYEAAS